MFNSYAIGCKPLSLPNILLSLHPLLGKTDASDASKAATALPPDCPRCAHCALYITEMCFTAAAALRRRREGPLLVTALSGLLALWKYQLGATDATDVEISACWCHRCCAAAMHSTKLYPSEEQYQTDAQDFTAMYKPAIMLLEALGVR